MLRWTLVALFASAMPATSGKRQWLCWSREPRSTCGAYAVADNKYIAYVGAQRHCHASCGGRCVHKYCEVVYMRKKMGKAYQKNTKTGSTCQK